MKKLTKLTNGQKVLQFVRKNPNAKAKEVSKATGVNVNSVYQAIYHHKKASKLPSTTAPNAQMSLLLFSDPPKKRGRPPLKTSSKNEMPLTEIRDGRLHLVRELTDNVNHPPHYKVGGIETIDFIEAKSLSYNLGNVVKYLTRADHKGNKLEDLKKAQWYLNREVSKLNK
jgi:hypothetical protein